MGLFSLAVSPLTDYANADWIPMSNNPRAVATQSNDDKEVGVRASMAGAGDTHFSG